MKITIADLEMPPRKEKACDDAREWFVKTFPTGTTKAKALAACPRGDWLIWALWNFKLATIEQVIMAGCAAGRRSLRFAREQDKAVLVAAFDAADAVADNNNEQTRSAARSAWSARAVESAARAVWSAALSAAESAWAAAWSARAAESAESAWSAEHKACADAIRSLMRTARYRRAGKGGA